MLNRLVLPSKTKVDVTFPPIGSKQASGLEAKMRELEKMLDDSRNNRNRVVSDIREGNHDTADGANFEELLLKEKAREESLMQERHPIHSSEQISHETSLITSISYNELFKDTKTLNYLNKQPTNARSFPVVLLCHDRVVELKNTVLSLFGVDQISRSKMLAVQDGFDSAVDDMLTSLEVRNIQHASLNEDDGAAKIAMHYKFALNKAFEVFSDAPAIIILEDDLLFSPDLLEYFALVGPLVELDPSLVAASAWNDNGFKNAVKDPKKILRTSFFPGLGWLLLRDEWENNLKHKWAHSHWDWFMRGRGSEYPENLVPADPNVIPEVRETVYPEISRSFHAGKYGTFMNPEMQAKYFDTVKYNDGKSRVTEGDVIKTLKPRYDELFEATVRDGMHLGAEYLGSLSDLREGRALVIWLRANPHPNKEEKVTPLMETLGIWHQLIRGQRSGVHEFWFQHKKIILINVYEAKKSARTKKRLRNKQISDNNWFSGYPERSKWLHLKPSNCKIYDPDDLLQTIKSLAASVKPSGPSLITQQQTQVIVASPEQVGESCDSVCASHGVACDAAMLPTLNTCTELRQYFQCSSCRPSIGGDQPAYLALGDEQEKCLYNTEPEYFSCQGHFPESRRLCACK